LPQIVTYDSTLTAKGRANDNPILDTRKYVVQFADGDEIELNANMIAEAIYAQCDPDGNQYVLLEALVDHRRNDKASYYYAMLMTSLL
jgi:hypothetical protein